MSVNATVDLNKAFLDAFSNISPSQGYTHTFYRYPARFSPQFVRATIKSFTRRGDCVLDPFMGSGTTLVESLASGRHAIGTDVNPLAHFLALSKTTTLSSANVKDIEKWLGGLSKKLSSKRASGNHAGWAELGYQKDLPWHIRKTTERILDEIDRLANAKQQRFVRCALLHTGQWALDCTTQIPSSAEFKEQFYAILRQHITQVSELKQAVSSLPKKPSVVCLDVPAAELNAGHWSNKLDKRPRLVVTSPPYPSVHVLYHRWQIRGRRETASPYWIVGEPDGHTAAFYTMGSRTPTGLDTYFESIETSFANIRGLLSPKASVVQLVAFSNVRSQLPRYLEAMEQAGFERAEIRVEEKTHSGNIWRRVPLRRWYASYQGRTSSAKELLLIHQKVD